MRVCIIGTGCISLATGVCLAHIGHHVICVDTDASRMSSMQANHSFMDEPELSQRMQSALQSGRLTFTTDMSTGITYGEIVFIAVSTPSLPADESDICCVEAISVEAIARSIGTHLTNEYKVVVMRSTMSIGTGDQVRQIVLDTVRDRQQPITHNFDIVSNPDFSRAGSAVYDTLNPDRLVFGSNSERAIALMQDLYAPIIHRQFDGALQLPPVPVVVTDLLSAEMMKYAAHAFLAAKLSFINEMANICDRLSADITQIAKGIGLDSRIGNSCLQAGTGWNDTCSSKAMTTLIHTAKDYGYNAELLQSIANTNERQQFIIIEKLQQRLKILRGKTIGFLGLPFQSATDDPHSVPDLALIERLNCLGSKVKLYDPMCTEFLMRSPVSTKVTVAANPEVLAQNSDALVLVTNQESFQHLDYDKLAILMRSPVVVDGRNFLDPNGLVEAGLHYISIGRSESNMAVFIEAMAHRKLEWVGGSIDALQRPSNFDALILRTKCVSPVRKCL